MNELNSKELAILRHAQRVSAAIMAHEINTDDVYDRRRTVVETSKKQKRERKLQKKLQRKAA